MEIDTRTVRVGDQIMIGAQPFTVRNTVTLAAGRKRLDFTDGESFTMLPNTVLWAARRTRVPPRGGARQT
ncbi:hypothetical protein [Streptomyces sp. SBT349]|uniref:hypothetical protein n=1 Tax=Streptomyces sp. SBT349 TaxID=1580539 RepID=UPI00131DC7A9|nr:hypothetical protein [Streptomyces sp. SBT349]